MEKLTLVALSLLMELFEFSWQYSLTLRGSLEKVYKVYKKSIFLFFLMHTGYLYFLFISLKFEILNFPLLLALSLKSMDIFAKIEMIKKLYFKTNEQDVLLEKFLDEKIPLFFYIFPILTYPYLLYWSLNW
jgi:hypothetical protein